MSALPKAVQQQIKRAQEIADQVYGQNGNPPAGDPPAGNPPVGDPPPPGSSVPGNPPGSPPADDAAPPTGTPPEGATPPTEGWEQRYKVLQGKYNAEVPRLIRQFNEQSEMVRDMRMQLTATQNLLASLSQQQRGTPPAADQPAGTPAKPNRLVKDEEVQEFGADLLDVVRRAAREEIFGAMPDFERRMAPIAQRADQAAQAVGQVAQRVARNDQQSVLDMLTEHVPKWQELNEDQGFLEWLDQVDPFSGHKRGALLDQAYKAHDGPRVVAFFSGYQKEHAAVTPPPPPAAQAQPAAQPQRKLEDLVAPGTPKSGAAVAPDGSGKRVFTRADISKFYADCTAGRYKDPAKRAAMEAEIFAAQREGRIR
jgi:hypothetical protein